MCLLWLRVQVGGVVVNSLDEVLMVQERVSPLPLFQGSWKLPGGLADPGEDFATTVRREVIEETGVANIAIDKSAEPGEIVITGFDDDAIADAQARIDAIAGGDGPPPIEVGEAFEGAEVKNVVPFGIFVELYDGLDGFCHISQLSEAYVSKMEDVGVAAGDKIDVKVTEYNKAKGQYRVAVTSPLEIKEGGGGGGGGRRGRG